MGSEWPRVEIQRLIKEGRITINDGYRAKNSELSSNGLPFARAQNINNGFHFDGADCFPISDLNKVGIKVSEPDDVVFTSKGTVGRFAFVRSTTPRFVYAPQLCFWRVLHKNTIVPKWLYYWVNSREFYVQIRGVASQTDMAEYVSLRDQRAMHITIPPLPEQRAIAHVLGSLDDKIELNRRMNETLEQMAQALFQSWFVDFEPVIDKALAAGNPIPAELQDKAERRQALGDKRKPLPSHITDLFPDRFVDSELGPIPEGWEVGELKSIADNLRDGTRPEELPPTTPYIGLQDMPRQSIALDEWGYAGDVGSQKAKFNKGNLLFGKLRPYFHKVGVAPVDGICSTDILVIVPKETSWHGYVVFLVSSKPFVDYADSRSSGTRMPRTNWKDMSQYGIPLPPQELAIAFQQISSASIDRIAENIFESRHLSRLRDTLLPQLISGELRIPDVEKMLAEVG